MVLAGAACGNAGPSRQDTIRKWDAICRATQARLEAIKVPNVSSRNDLPRFIAAIDKALPVALNEIDELRSVPVPNDDQKTADAILSDLVHAIGDLEAAEDAAKRGDLDGTERALQGAAGATKAAGAAARSFGLKVCGRAA